MKEWRKKGTCHNLEEYVLEQTGKQIEEFLDVNKNYPIKDLDKVSEVLGMAQKEHKTVTIVGDYDVDGIGAVVILGLLCSILNISFVIIIPKRMSEGYGISEKIVARIETDIVITVDNGISAVEPIKKLKMAGKTVIILDHHIPGEELPPADIIINPSAFPDTAVYAHYCGAGLAYKVAEYILGNIHPFLNILSGYAAKLFFKTFHAIGFNMAEEYKAAISKDTEYYDMIGFLQKNHYNGKVYFQVRLLDLRKSEESNI